ncbi:MAG: hypothetical protein A2X94_12715 [Bdellovibrionales bacterium GWB1_55_8]|nr:MAG: hypothetical protein A2X94_12715 [Bdellovibrionales bacterium GWB1_55_8]
MKFFKFFKTIKSVLVAGVLLGAICDAGAAGIWSGYDELTPDQQKTIQRGAQVVLTQDVPGAPWPKITIYQRIDATSEEALAVFADYELQKTYIPDMTESKIAGKVDAATTRVDYVMDLAGEVEYTTDSRVSTYDNGLSYRMDWTMVEGDSMKEMWGSARFEQLGTGSMIIYHTFIRPTSGFAGWFRKKAIEMAKTGAGKLVQQIQMERKDKPDLLARQLETLRASLGQGSRSRQCDDWHWNGGLFCSSL